MTKFFDTYYISDKISSQHRHQNLILIAKGIGH